MANISEFREIILQEASKKKPHEKIKKTVITIGFIAAFPFILAGSIVITPILFGIAGLYDKKKDIRDKQNAREITEQEFKQIIREINEVSDYLLKMQKSCKMYNLVYRYHDNRKFHEYKNNKVFDYNPLSVFNSGKPLIPYRIVSYYHTDTIETYKNLVDKRTYSDKPIDADENYDYFYDSHNEANDDMYEHLINLGFSFVGDNYGRSDKYPNVYANVTSNIHGVWVVISPRTSGYLKKKSEKSGSIGKFRDMMKG